MRVDRHLVLVVPKMLDGVCCSRVPIEARHYELLWETVREHLLEKWRVGSFQAIKFNLLVWLQVRLFDPPLNHQLIDVLDARNLQNLAGPRILRVLFVTRSVGSVTPPTVLDTGGFRSVRRDGGV